MGAACSNSNKIVSETVRKTNNKKKNCDQDSEENQDGIVNDPNSQNLNQINSVRDHEKLWQAVEKNDQTAAEKYLSQNEIQENNLYDSFGQSMLHKAAHLGHTEMLILLIDRTGAKPDLVNSNLATPLHLASRSNRETVVKFLIGCGVDANAQDEHGQTPLLISCIHGHKEIVSLLIEASIVGHLTEPLEIDTPNHQGLTPLNCASIKGDFEIVKLLVTRGAAQIDQQSPKGCTPLIYAGRGGYSNVVNFLIQKKASALKQDNAGGTIFHHAIEKGHINVLETMLQNGVDVYSAIEIADNAGRTPIFEAVENLNEENSERGIEIIKILTNSKDQNGYEANPNVVNYNGQTPLFSAVRQGYIGAVKALIESQADPDLQNGEMVKQEDDEELEEYESLQEQYFMEAFKNCMTPLHVAAVLGYDDIALYLILECGSDPNLQTNSKGYTVLHLSVLANKPEMIIELLTKTKVDPMIEDSQGRTLLDMVYKFIPSYVETFQNILENLSTLKLVQQNDGNQVTSNVDDNRKISGAKTQEQIQQMYAKEMEMKDDENFSGGKTVNLATIDENDLPTDVEIDSRIENIFGRKITLCLASQNWQYKELALKFVFRTSEKFLTRSEVGGAMPYTLCEIVEGTLAAVKQTCRDKVIKVFNISLQLFNMVVQSSRVEKDVAAIRKVRQLIKKEELVNKLLLQSEQSNTRVTNKIHEALLDLCFQPQLGEELVVEPLLNLITKHNIQNMNPKGLLAQIALLFKLVNSFDIQLDNEETQDSAICVNLTKKAVLQAVLPAINHTKDDVRNAAVKVLVDVQQRNNIFTLEDLNSVNEKSRMVLWEKMQQKLDDESSNNHHEQDSQKQKQIAVSNKVLSDQNQQLRQQQQTNTKLTDQDLKKFKQIIEEKGQHKEWTQREIAISAILECFSMNCKGLLDQEEEFLGQCTILLQSSLDDNNMQIYLCAVEATFAFIRAVPASIAVFDALPSIIKALVLHTTDTNTRVRKRSVEVINFIWDIQLNKSSSENSSQIIAKILFDPTLNEKAIIGRLGLFIKKAISIESKEDISKKPFLLLLGKDYEQLIQFACSWCLHKNTKVRQCALKLAVEICRLNVIDTKGAPFKQRIVNYILGLRPSIRDPLIKKINEVCQQQNELNQDYINITELEFNFATKQRIASQDIRKIQTQKDESLPSIGTASQLPQVQMDNNSRPTIVLPHSEPISDSIKEKWSNLIETFGTEIVRCLNSQTWSTRHVAIQKIGEQLINLDPNRRDAMLSEINKNNQPPEVTFKLFLKLTEEMLQDPVLKNYISVLDLVQKALPIYFRYLRPEQIRRELASLISQILAKTSDLKQKVREASINFCLYLSHQSPVGPETMINAILNELQVLQWDKVESSNTQKQDQTNPIGNSNMIASCLKLLSQYQQQTGIVTETSTFFSQYVLNIQKSLKHTNPQVRKEGEQLFLVLAKTAKVNLLKEIKDQKPQIIQKLTNELKAQTMEQAQEQANTQLNQSTKEYQENSSSQQVKQQIKQDFLNQPSILTLMKGNEEKLQQLKQPNPKKRLIAIVEIKKSLQNKLNQINQNSAMELVEPMSLLIRHLLRDDNADVYLESLNLLKFIVGSLAQHLSTFDLHLMIGQFISVIVTGASQNIRQRVASDKVIVYFAKHINIGSLIVAKEILKNIERLNKSTLVKAMAKDEGDFEERKLALVRFYGILQLLLQQFSIVLCYSPDFYSKLLDSLADSMSKAIDEPNIRSICQQVVVSLYQIDVKLLDQSVQQLDFTKKTHFKKIIIELESQTQKGKQILIEGNQNFLSTSSQVQNPRLGSPDASFRDTQQSFTSQNTRQTIMSPGIGLNKRLNRDRNSEVRTSRTNADCPSAIITETPNELRRATIDQGKISGVNWLDRKTSEANKTVTLPNIEVSNVRKRQFGQGYIGNVASGKAAGFNRDDFNATANFTSSKPGLNFDQDFSQITVNNGLGSGLFSQKNQNETFQTQSQTKNQNPLDMLSPKNSYTRPLNEPDINETKASAVRPPLYVPTQRTLQVAKTESYQPSLLERRTKQITAEGEQGQGIEKTNGTSQRYKQPSQLPALPGISLVTQLVLPKLNHEIQDRDQIIRKQ